jgi:hypothetical protein
MKKGVILLCIFIFSLPGLAQAQFDTAFARSRIMICLDSLSDAFIQKDWEKYSRYTNPALIGAFGGKQEFLRYTRGSFSGIPDTAWKKYEAGDLLQVIKTDGDLQAIVELNSILEWQGMRITTTSHLVAQSWDGGYFWNFFDSRNDRAASSLIKSDLSPLLIIPERKEKMEKLVP